MKKKKLPLFIFIDAFGWEVLKKNPDFLADKIVDKRRLSTILGYSSACDPSIITGLMPNQHRQWSSFYYSPDTCPYPWVKYLRIFPSPIMNYHRVRYRLSRLIKKVQKFTGYFQIYNVPFKYLPLFDYAEKQWIWGEEGVREGMTIFNLLQQRSIPYFVHELDRSDEYSLNQLSQNIKNQDIDFAYISMGKLDALMHAKGTNNPQINDLVKWYDQQIRDLISLAEENYGDVPFYIFTDHGMHDIKETFDLQAEIAKTGLDFGKDYVAIYDSTMARFWYLKDTARAAIAECLNQQGKGRILSDDETRDLGVYFADSMYGETIFLMNSHVQIVPSFMGAKFTPGIHGFHPNDDDSYASLSSNRQLPDGITGIQQIFWLMLQEMNFSAPTTNPVPAMPAWFNNAGNAKI